MASSGLIPMTATQLTGSIRGGGGAGYIGAYGGAYAPPPIDPTLQQREAAKYDGIMHGYWEALTSGHEFPWLGSDVFEQSKSLVKLLRSPVAHEAVRMTERHYRKRDARDDFINEMEFESYNEKKRVSFGLFPAGLPRSRQHAHTPIVRTPSLWERIFGRASP